MHLLTIKIENFKKIKKTEISFPKKNIPQIIPIIGLNGSEKTTLLEAINALKDDYGTIENIYFTFNKKDLQKEPQPLTLTQVYSLDDKEIALIHRKYPKLPNKNYKQYEQILQYNRKERGLINKKLRYPNIVIHQLRNKNGETFKLENFSKTKFFNMNYNSAYYSCTIQNQYTKKPLYRSHLYKNEPEDKEDKQNNDLVFFLLFPEGNQEEFKRYVQAFIDNNEDHSKFEKTIEYQQLKDKVTTANKLLTDITPILQRIFKIDIFTFRLTFLRLTKSISFELQCTHNENFNFQLEELPHGVINSFYILLYLKLSQKINNNNDIMILIDEPDMHLHPQAQRNFLNEAINLIQSSHNIKLLYTTHSIYLLTPELMKNTIVVTNNKDKGVLAQTYNKFRGDYSKPYYTFMDPMLNTLGYTPPFATYDRPSLIVEGKCDAQFLSLILPSLSDKYSIIPASGTDTIKPIACILISWQQKILILVDSDRAGQQCLAKCKKIFEDFEEEKRIKTIHDFWPNKEQFVKHSMEDIIITLYSEEIKPFKQHIDEKSTTNKINKDAAQRYIEACYAKIHDPTFCFPQPEPIRSFAQEIEKWIHKYLL